MTHESVLPSRHRHRHGLRLCGLFVKQTTDLITETLCEYPGRPRNGVVSGIFPAGFRSVATFSCNPGYQMEGSDAVVCTANGQWSNTIPECKGSYKYFIVLLYLDDYFYFVYPVTSLNTV